MATIAQLTVDLTARTASFTRSFNQAQSTIQQFQRSAKKVTRDLDDIARAGKRAGLG